MSQEVTLELERRFRAAEFNPREFSFWVAIHDYIALVKAKTEIKAIVDTDEAQYHEAFIVISEAFRSRPREERGRLHNKEVTKIESLSLYCHYLDLELIYDAIHEMANKHLLHLGGIKCFNSEHHHSLEAELTEEAVKYERELTEIQRRKLSRRNILLQLASKYQRSLQFVHRKLMNALAESTVQKLKSKTETGLSFDNKSGVLVVNGMEVRIKRRGPISKAHRILAYIFIEREQTHPFSFIYEDLMKSDYSDKDWRVIYNACEYLNQRVAKDTNHKITDFLQFTSYTSGEVKINSKYLGK